MRRIILNIVKYSFLCEYKFFRRLAGGRWEKWYVDVPICSLIWHHDSDGLGHSDGRPSVLCRGTPTVEDYNKKE
jgi:hypothetical protein